MYHKLHPLTVRWEEKVRLKSDYRSGQEAILLPEFAHLFQDTFRLILDINSEYIYPGTAPATAWPVMDYLKLIAAMARYCADADLPDFSEQKAFTATRLISKKLVECASEPSGSFRTANGTVYFHTEELLQGDLYFSPARAPVFDDDFENTPPRYNVFEGSFEAVLQLAAQLCSQTQL